MSDLISEVTQKTEKPKEKKKLKKTINKYDDLVTVVNSASHLKKDDKTLFIKLAELFTEDFKKNLFSDQFTLSDKYPDTTYNEWAKFLNDSLIRTNLSRHKNTLMVSGAEANLYNPEGSNKRDNLNLLKLLEEKDKNFSNQQIIITRIPPKYDE